MKWTLLFFLLLTRFQNNTCEDFENEMQPKITTITKKIIELQKPHFLNKKELLSIALPEYITYSESKNQLEIILVKSNLYFKNSKLDLSFGPFQMKLSFIKKVLDRAPSFVLNDVFLENLKKRHFHLNSSDIDKLNNLQTQWNLLRAFEYVNKKVYNQHSIVGYYSLYNSGKVKKDVVFTNIKCKNMSYSEWCIELYDIINR